MKCFTSLASFPVGDARRRELIKRKHLDETVLKVGEGERVDMANLLMNCDCNSKNTTLFRKEKKNVHFV